MTCNVNFDFETITQTPQPNSWVNIVPTVPFSADGNSVACGDGLQFQTDANDSLTVNNLILGVYTIYHRGTFTTTKFQISASNPGTFYASQLLVPSGSSGSISYNAVSASYALTASYVSGSGGNAVTSSYAVSSSVSNNAVTASIISNPTADATLVGYTPHTFNRLSCYSASDASPAVQIQSFTGDGNISDWSTGNLKPGSPNALEIWSVYPGMISNMQTAIDNTGSLWFYYPKQGVFFFDEINNFRAHIQCLSNGQLTTSDIIATNFLGTASLAKTASLALSANTASFVTASNIHGTIATASLATTASFDLKRQKAFCQVSFNALGGGTTYTVTNAFDIINFSGLAGYALTDPGSNYDSVNNQYVVPFSGYYETVISLRPTDNTTPDSFGIGSGTSNIDNPQFHWKTSNASPRWEAQAVNIQYFNAGDRIEMYAYSDNSDVAIYGSMTIVLLF